jgi:hypothetical protein
MNSHQPILAMQHQNPLARVAIPSAAIYRDLLLRHTAVSTDRTQDDKAIRVDPFVRAKQRKLKVGSFGAALEPHPQVRGWRSVSVDPFRIAIPSATSATWP